MSKPYIHAKSSAKKYGGQPEDYLEIHSFMDISKGALPDNRHRALTHNSWFIMHILTRVFGETFKNSDGKTISTRDIAEQHVLEDFNGKFIPTVQDYFQEMEFKPWMQNGQGYPPSAQKIAQNKRRPTSKTPPLSPSIAVVDGARRDIKDVTYDGASRFMKD